MSKGTLTTLDFVISVLHEHEKELTELSDKLEEVVISVLGQNLKKDIDQIQSTLNELKQKILIIDQKITASTNPSIEPLLKRLMSQVSIQDQNLNLLNEATKDYPTNKEVEDLKASISSLNTFIKELLSKQDQKAATLPSSGS